MSDQAVHLVEGLELDKLNEKFLPIKDTHQVGYVQEATHNVFFVFCVLTLEYLDAMLNHCFVYFVDNPGLCSITASQQAIHLFRQHYL